MKLAEGHIKMRIKILSMSIAAIMTVAATSSVMAFDTNDTNAAGVNEPILVQDSSDLAAYQGDLLPLAGSVANPHSPVPSTANLALASNGRGDALIFPLFTQDGDWGTEIVVRNTDKNHAIVAKVAIYANDDSREVLDFNVYLSAADVVRFKIENGNLISEDGSVLRDLPAPSSNLDDVDASDFASAGNPFTKALSLDSGYVVVYGMAQAKTDAHSLRYHNDHARLFADYRSELDTCRPGWRIGHHNAIQNGTYVRQTTNSSVDNFSVAAPNQAENCTASANTAVVSGNFFGDVDASLTGTVRLYSATNGARDMLLPAKAIANFTAGNKIIWTEGEISALQDRRIVGEDVAGVDIDWAEYDEAGIRADAAAFLVSNTTYTFAAASLNNKLSITQPYKRALVQLGNDDGYWQDTATNYGGFSFIYNVFNEHEKMDNTSYTESPHNSGITILRHELESMTDLEGGTEFEGENGFALLRFTDVNGQDAGIPAVITQMVGSTINGAPQLNWIYSQTN